VESNGDIQNDLTFYIFHVASLSGRETGYYEVAQRSGSPNSLRSLVSVYSNQADALAAYNSHIDYLRTVGWNLDVGYANNPQGDPGYASEAHNEYPSSGYGYLELFFKRGRIIVQVWHSYPLTMSLDDRVTYANELHDISMRLDAVALQVQAATPIPPTSSPTSQPTQVPIPTPRPSATPFPTQTSTGGGSRGDGPALLFTASGAGSKTTRIFAAPATWALDWWFNCASRGKPGHFTLTAKDHSAIVTPQVSRTGLRVHGVANFSFRGQIHLVIKTACHWHVKVYG
jgi:hypothetical protein